MEAFLFGRNRCWSDIWRGVVVVKIQLRHTNQLGAEARPLTKGVPEGLDDEVVEEHHKIDTVEEFEGEASRREHKGRRSREKPGGGRVLPEVESRWGLK